MVIELLRVKIPPKLRENKATLQAIALKFDAAMGKSYPIVESAEYQVRKFPHS